MAETCARAVEAGIEGIAFGDLFLEDVRAYREKQMRGTGLPADISLVGTAHSGPGKVDDRLWHAGEADLC